MNERTNNFFYLTQKHKQRKQNNNDKISHRYLPFFTRTTMAPMADNTNNNSIQTRANNITEPEAEVLNAIANLCAEDIIRIKATRTIFLQFLREMNGSNQLEEAIQRYSLAEKALEMLDGNIYRNTQPILIELLNISDHEDITRAARLGLIGRNIDRIPIHIIREFFIESKQNDLIQLSSSVPMSQFQDGIIEIWLELNL